MELRSQAIPDFFFPTEGTARIMEFRMPLLFSNNCQLSMISLVGGERSEGQAQMRALSALKGRGG